LRKSLGLKANLVLHLILLFYSFHVHPLALLVLLFNHFGLLGFLLFLKQQGVLHFLFFVVALLGNDVVVLAHVALLLVIELDVEDFLKTVSSKLNLPFGPFLRFAF